MEPILYSLIAGVSTLLGAILLVFFKSPGNKTLAVLLGFAGGVMLAISFFDLLPEALEFGSALTALIGFLLGAGIMFALDRFIPHAHLSTDQAIDTENVPGGLKPNNHILRIGYLVFLGMALHNIPEGIAIGAGYESSPELGLYIAIAIGLHNVPEGIVVAGLLKAGGLPVFKVLLLTLIAGLMAPVGAGIGLIFFNISPVFVAGGMAFAAGAMVYIVNDELIPQSHKLSSHIAIAGLIAGMMLVFMLHS